MATAIALPEAQQQVLTGISQRAKNSRNRAVIQVESWCSAAQGYTTWLVTVDCEELAATCGMVTALGRNLLHGTGHVAVKGQVLYCPI